MNHELLLKGDLLLHHIIKFYSKSRSEPLVIISQTRVSGGVDLQLQRVLNSLIFFGLFLDIFFFVGSEVRKVFRWRFVGRDSLVLKCTHYLVLH